MDFVDEVRALAARISSRIEHLETEEATKNALVMPFINVLGYSVFDPTQVVPEFTADIGTRKGEKVDYAIMKDGKPTILIECKRVGADLNKESTTQLFRYFTATEARFGILTDGIIYRFFSDLDEPNKMDLKPFLEFNILETNDSVIAELKRFTKDSFVLDETVEAATELKYTKEIKRILAEQLRGPDPDFVKFFASQVYSGTKTKPVIQRFTQLTRHAFQQFINDRITDRLSSALARETGSGVENDQLSDADPTSDENEEESRPGVVTTDEEVEGLHIVKAILRQVVDVERVVMRDTKSYCGIILDDNRRKPICRLWLNSSQRYLGVFDSEKHEERIAIDSIYDIFEHADRLKAAVGYYDTA